MRHQLNPLFFWFAHASHRDLIRQLEFLKVENQILRGKLGRQVRVTPWERRRLIRLGTRVGPAIRELLSIVTTKTWDRWLNGANWRKGVRPRKPGRPRTPEEIEELVLRIPRETSWGFTRILGELKKLGIHTICRSTVVNILRRHGMEPGPQRGPGTWDQFIKRHARTLWACDFLPKRILTWRGWKDAYLLVFINVKSRRLWFSPATFHPTRAWTAAQAERFCRRHADDANAPGLVIRDRDSKFSGPFDAALRANNVQPLVVQHCSPNMNAYAERPHQAFGNVPPVRVGRLAMGLFSAAHGSADCFGTTAGELQEPCIPPPLCWTEYLHREPIRSSQFTLDFLKVSRVFRKSCGQASVSAWLAGASPPAPTPPLAPPGRAGAVGEGVILRG